MKKSFLNSYSIMPLDTEHLEEICQDIKEQYESGISTLALFSMTLVPEGNPPVDKAGSMCKKYKLFQDKLNSMGLKCGVLVQASVGHGWISNPAPFQNMVGFNNGKVENAYCPEDDRTVSYLADAIKRIAMEHPKVIMLDDDVRLLIRPFEGCACPLHMKKLNDIQNLDGSAIKIISSLLIAGLGIGYLISLLPTWLYGIFVIVLILLYLVAKKYDKKN
jgi:hypothetical protein